MSDGKVLLEVRKLRLDSYPNVIEDITIGTFDSLAAAKSAGDWDAGRPLEWEPYGDSPERWWAEPEWTDYRWFINPPEVQS